jgi:hypothetical protein
MAGSNRECSFQSCFESVLQMDWPEPVSAPRLANPGCGPAAAVLSWRADAQNARIWTPSVLIPPEPIPKTRCEITAPVEGQVVTRARAPDPCAVAGHVCRVSLLGLAAFVRGADRRGWAGDRTPAGCVRSTMRRDGALPVDFPGNRCTEHADAPACEDGPDGGTGCAVQVPCHEASQEECPDDQAPDDPHGVGWPILHWPAPRGWPGTHLVQEDPHGSASILRHTTAAAAAAPPPAICVTPKARRCRCAHGLIRRRMPCRGGVSHHPRRPFAAVLSLGARIGMPPVACGAGHPATYKNDITLIDEFQRGRLAGYGRDIVITFGQEEAPALALRSPGWAFPARADPRHWGGE